MRPPLAPPGEFGEAMDIARTALREVLGDGSVWHEEAARLNPAPLPWPLARRGKPYERLLRHLALEVVDAAAASMLEAAGYVLTIDQQDPRFQWVLRVVKRAVDAADHALRQHYSTPTRGYKVSGKREFLNWVKKQQVETAIRSGLSRSEALSKLGISRAAAYRAMKR